MPFIRCVYIRLRKETIVQFAPLLKPMKKFGTLIAIVIVACVLGGIYGMLHDQISYSISHEYYTKFKFYQFRLVQPGEAAAFPQPRLQVALVGFMASWWMGIPIGLILGVVNVIGSKGPGIFKTAINALLITIAIAFITGLVGLAVGHYVLSNQPRSNFNGWYIPDDVVDFKNFITVGTMHNFSYLGGLFGLIAGIIYTVRHKRRHAIK